MQMINIEMSGRGVDTRSMAVSDTEEREPVDSKSGSRQVANPAALEKLPLRYLRSV